MKLTKHYPNIIRLFILSILIAFSGCSENSQTEPTSKKALLPDNFIANDDIGSSLGVKNARDANHKNQILVVAGFIGGMKILLLQIGPCSF